jgi:predicted dehydrogenase
MGVSHHALINAHPAVKVAAVCDSAGYILDILNKYTGVPVFTNYEKMLREAELDAVIVATPSRFHAAMVEQALDKGLHVFCEKPFCLSAADAERLSAMAAAKGLVNQVGYHYRFVGSFQEVKRLLDLGAIGKVTHVLAEAYGPVVLRPKGSTWRTQQSEGGGCLYDYAAHPINLLNWYFGAPGQVSGSVLNKVFSRDTDDEVYSTLQFDGDVSAQLSVNWSDESYRKMSTKISIWGEGGRIVADRQECQAYLRNTQTPPAGYVEGWNVKNTTELTDEVWFYIRGEEYSAQLDHFVRRIGDPAVGEANSFASAAQTDQVIAMIVADASGAADTVDSPKKKARGLFRF